MSDLLYKRKRMKGVSSCKKTSMLILGEISMHLSDYEKRFEFVTSVTRFLFAVDHFVWDYMYV
jgi:hypothetical protein